MMSEEPVPVELVAAALRADAADVQTLVRVLANTLGDTLPAGMVEVRRARSWSDRLRGRDGAPVAVSVTAPEVRLTLSTDEHQVGAVRAEAQRIVHGVVISRSDLTVEQWVTSLAQVVSDLATRNADARAALARLLSSPE